MDILKRHIWIFLFKDLFVLLENVREREMQRRDLPSAGSLSRQTRWPGLGHAQNRSQGLHTGLARE